MQRLLAGIVMCLVGASASWAQPSAEERHLLGRWGYGQDPWSLARLRALGPAGYLEEQLQPATIPDPVLHGILAADPDLRAFQLTIPELVVAFADGTATPTWELMEQARYEHLLRATLSRRQLEALLLEFWFNHFNVAVGGSNLRFLIPYLRDTLRPRLLGRFEDLLVAVARAPAMLAYLDNWRNFRPGYVRGGVTVGPNENYARELLELHTLGAGDQAGFYGQADVREVARCLTGWSIDYARGFRFEAAGHDLDAKRPLGLSIPAGGGEEDGLLVLRHLAAHPRTAAFLSAKLVRFFVGPGQPELTARARERWKTSGGDLRQVLRLILASPELRAARGTKVKRPNLLFVSAMRSVGVDLSAVAGREPTFTMMGYLCRDLGLPLFQVQAPTGWSDAPMAFVNEGAMLERAQFLEWVFAPGTPRLTCWLGSAGRAAPLVDELGARILGVGGMAPGTRSALVGYLADPYVASRDRARRARLVQALLFAAPEFASY